MSIDISTFGDVFLLSMCVITTTYFMHSFFNTYFKPHNRSELEVAFSTISLIMYTLACYHFLDTKDIHIHVDNLKF